jgi:hypothetical protein
MNVTATRNTTNTDDRHAAMPARARGLSVGVSVREPSQSWVIEEARTLSVGRAARRVLNEHVPGARREEDFARTDSPREERLSVAEAELSGSLTFRAENEPTNSPRRNSIG